VRKICKKPTYFDIFSTENIETLREAIRTNYDLNEGDKNDLEGKKPLHKFVLTGLNDVSVFFIY
jgi:hypothetical protein